jgi:hypothetical protein
MVMMRVLVAKLHPLASCLRSISPAAVAAEILLRTRTVSKEKNLLCKSQKMDENSSQWKEGWKEPSNTACLGALNHRMQRERERERERDSSSFN